VQGFTVTAGACSGGPVSGGAFNPAVGFGLPLMAGEYDSMAIYMFGPMLGAGLAALLFRLTNPNVQTHSLCFYYFLVKRQKKGTRQVVVL